MATTSSGAAPLKSSTQSDAARTSATMGASKLMARQKRRTHEASPAQSHI